MGKAEGGDVVTLEIVNNALSSIIDQMALTVTHTSYSPLCRELFDFSTGLTDPEGDILAEGLTSASHSGVLQPFIQATRKAWGDKIYPSDIFICNDPYEGAAHLPDVFIARPIFVNNEVVAFGCAVAHQLDMGGRVAGSNACDNTEIYQEGVRMPPLKYYERGVRNYTLYRLLQKNVRISHMILGDIEALVAATAVGERRFLELAEKYSWPTLHRYINELMDYSERMTRATIRALPDGVYEDEDFLDDDGFIPKPVKIHTKIIVDGDNITFDFTGSSPTATGSINLPLASTIGLVNVGIRLLLGPEIPSNGGVRRALKIIAPEDTIVNVGFPRGVAGRGATSGRLYDSIMRALTKLVPDKMMACGVNLDFGICIGGKDANDNPFVFVDFLAGSWGARPWADAVNANTPLWINYSNIPCEVMEREYPVRIEQYSFIPGTGGPGKYRGGVAMIKDYRILVDNANVQWRQDRAIFPAWGLQGGKPGSLTRGFHISGDKVRELKKSLFIANKGDLLRCVLAGGGGFGNPSERDVEKVLEDVRNEIVSIESARRDYSTVIDKETMQVNLEETKKLRKGK